MTEFGKKTNKKKIAGIVILAIIGIFGVLIAIGLNLDSTPMLPNTQPTANAGPDQTVNEDTTVQLDGSGSTDPDGTIASYSWTLTNGPSVTLSDASSATPSFTAPDVGADGETLRFELTATDNDGSTSTTADTVAVNVDNVVVNQLPIANAGPDQKVQEDIMVVLNATNSSDPDSVVDNKENLAFSWSQKDDTGNMTRFDLVGEKNTATPIFIAPSINDDLAAAAPMTLMFELRVTDQHASSSNDTVNVTIYDSPKTEVKAIKKVDPLDINVSGSNNNDESPTTTNTTTVALALTGFGSTSTEESTVPMDIVFAIDSSNSMEDNDVDNLRLQAAKLFLDKLNQTQDRAGVVNWDSQVEDTFGLTSDYESLKTILDQTTLGSGTNLDEGLRGAIGIFDSSNSTESISGSGNESSSKAIVFLTDGIGEYTPSSNLTESLSFVDEAKSKGYRIFSIGLNIQPGSDAENNLIDMASATGGQYFSSPTAGNLAGVFNATLQTVVRVSNTAPENVDVIEVTEDYIEGETNFSVEPTSINQTLEGRTMISWMNISQHVGNKDDKLTTDETFVVTFSAGSSKAGSALPVNSAEQSIVSYVDTLGNQKRVQVSQAYINVR